MDNVTKVIVNSKYLPSSGTANEVGGMISASSKKNTVNETRMELHNVTWNKYKKSIKSQFLGWGYTSEQWADFHALLVSAVAK